jgi:hypothetical protein
MIKRKVKQKMRDVKEIIELWIKFGNIVKDAQASKSSTKEKESEFLNIKTELARKQQLLGAAPLKIMNLLSQAVSLEDIVKMPEMQMKKFYIEWHETYLNLNELLGKVESGEITLERPKLISKRDQPRRHLGCLYDIILLIALIVGAYICFRVYEKRFDLRTKIQGGVFEKVLQKFEKIIPEKFLPPSEKMIDDKETEEGEKL